MTEGTDIPEGQRRLSAEQLDEIRQGQRLLHNFFSVLRTAIYHSSNNAAMAGPSVKFVASLASFREILDGPVKLEIEGGQFFAGTIRIRPAKVQRPLVAALEKFMKRRGLGGLIFLGEFKPDELRVALEHVAAFRKPIDAPDGVESLTAILEEAGFSERLKPTEPTAAHVRLDAEKEMRELNGIGQVAVQVARGVAMVKATLDSDSDVARAGTRHVVREVSDLSGEVRDSAVGLSMVGACDDLAMRSMTVLMVAVVIAEELGASRDMKADLGQACVELHGYDKEFVDSVEDGEKERAAAGVKAIKWLMGYRVWTQSLMRQGLCLASRHMKPDSEGFCASPLAQILRAAADYVDLTTPSPLVDSELFLSGGPLPPHRAMQRMKQEVGSRYSGAVMRGLVQGLGLLPVGTPVEMADGHGAVVVERTADPLCFIVADTLSRRRREANFKPGPNQIVRVVTGGDLLKVRGHFLLGDDLERLEKISQDLMDDEDE